VARVGPGVGSNCAKSVHGLGGRRFIDSVLVTVDIQCNYKPRLMKYIHHSSARRNAWCDVSKSNSSCRICSCIWPSVYDEAR
jgi:hypothetical protein